MVGINTIVSRLLFSTVAIVFSDRFANSVIWYCSDAFNIVLMQSTRSASLVIRPLILYLYICIDNLNHFSRIYPIINNSIGVSWHDISVFTVELSPFPDVADSY